MRCLDVRVIAHADHETLGMRVRSRFVLSDSTVESVFDILDLVEPVRRHRECIAGEESPESVFDTGLAGVGHGDGEDVEGRAENGILDRERELMRQRKRAYAGSLFRKER